MPKVKVTLRRMATITSEHVVEYVEGESPFDHLMDKLDGAAIDPEWTIHPGTWLSHTVEPIAEDPSE